MNRNEIRESIKRSIIRRKIRKILESKKKERARDKIREALKKRRKKRNRKIRESVYYEMPILPGRIALIYQYKNGKWHLLNEQGDILGTVPEQYLPLELQQEIEMNGITPLTSEEEDIGDEDELEVEDDLEDDDEAVPEAEFPQTITAESKRTPRRRIRTLESIRRRRIREFLKNRRRKK